MQIVDTEVSEEDAPVFAQKVISTLFEKGLIEGELNNDNVLSNAGYAPGPNLTQICEDEAEFWTLKTSGVSINIGRNFNSWALAEALEFAQCPACDFEHDHHDIWETSIGDALDEWHKGKESIYLNCYSCRQNSDFFIWQFSPPLGFGNLSFTFWNWPPFDHPCWKISIPDLLQNSLGHQIEISWGRL